MTSASNFMQWGFCGIKDHSIDKELVKEVVGYLW